MPLEGVGAFKNRVRAAIAEYGPTDGLLAWVDAPLTFGQDARGDASEAHLIREAKTLERRCGMPVGAILIDTLSRAYGGADENDAASASALQARLDRIKRATGAAIILIAHPGKDAERGIRGSSALGAGIDFEIRIEREGKEPERKVVLHKSRDGQDGVELGAFTLKVVSLGVDQDGDEVTSCVVQPISATTYATEKVKRPAPNSASAKALNELEQLIASDGERIVDPRIPDNVVCVTVDRWREACRQKRLTGDKSIDAEKKAWQRAFRELTAQNGPVGSYDDHVWLVARGRSQMSPCFTYKSEG